MNQDLINSLAILKVNFDREVDYIENFVPFVAESLRGAPQPEVSTTQLQELMLERFGLRIPQGALKTIVGRLVKKGYARRHHRMVLRNDGALAELDFTKVQAEALRQNRALIDKFVRFCRARYAVELTEERAESVLVGYLKELSGPVLAATVQGEALPELGSPREKDFFLFHSFVAHLCESDPEGFRYLETVVKGNMLANVLFFPAEIGAVKQRFSHVEIYFDTSCLLRALGFGPRAFRDQYRELMGILYELNADLRCFEHTLHEMIGVLDFSRVALQNPRGIDSNSEVLRYFVRNDFSSSDVELIIAGLEHRLNTLRVRVKQRPPFVDRLGIDERRLESVLHDEVGYHRNETLRHDVDSLAAIYRLREGRPLYTIERCGALFVTDNSALVEASKRFFREEYGSQTSRVPHCILDHHLTTLVWVKKPLDVPDLPRRAIVADCYAALNPSDALWRMYLREIERLQESGELSENDYYLLRFSTQAEMLLTETTMGDPAYVTEGTVREIYSRAMMELGAEDREALEEERAERLREREGRLRAERMAEDAEARRRAERRVQRERIARFSVKVGGALGNVARALLFIVQIAIAATSFLPSISSLLGNWWWLLRMLLFMVCVNDFDTTRARI
jgi:hypothetical protein